MKRYITYAWLIVVFNLLITGCQSTNKTYTNPILKPGKYNHQSINSMADPFILTDNGKYYMYVTGNGFPCFSSTDLVTWEYEGKTMNLKASKWAVRSFWAPEVVKIGNQYYLHYTAARQDNIKRIGLAVSDSPTGPFTKYAHNPILSNKKIPGKVSGPGHHTVVQSPDKTEWFCVYHSHVHVGNLNRSNNGVRQINIDRLEFLPDGSIQIHGPTVTPQPHPSTKK